MTEWGNLAFKSCWTRCLKLDKKLCGKAVHVVYQTPLSYGKTYVGQIGHCVNDRMREQKQFKKDMNTHLSAHCKSCSCKPRFSEVRIPGMSRDKTARELLEAYHIQISGQACVSQTCFYMMWKWNCWVSHKQHDLSLALFAAPDVKSVRNIYVASFVPNKQL